jgi:hypothetical protein
MKDILAAIEKKLEAQGMIANGEITPKGWELFLKQWRAWKARKPN